jgi:putative ABC transport system permease protein
MGARTITQGLRRLFNPQAADRDLDDEIAQYIAAAAGEYVRGGMTPAEAGRRARMDFVGVEASKEAVRDAGWESSVDVVRRDVAFAVRTLRRNSALTAAAILTLALGIGAVTSMFTVLNAVILRPLPYREPDRLALIWTDDTRRGLHQERTAFRTIEDWRRETRAFQSIAHFTAERATIAVNGNRERSRNVHVSGNLFGLLGVHPVIGRVLTQADEGGSGQVAVISHALWQRQFQGDSNVIGKTLVIEGYQKGGGLLTIVGVMPRGFAFPDAQSEIFVPATAYWRFGREASERFPAWARRWTAIGRLRDDATVEDARADLTRIGNRLTASHPPTVPDFPGFRTNVVPILDSVAGTNLRTALWILMGAVLLVLLVACANVANLLLARGASRQQELMIRGALGARRSRLVGQLLSESLLLAIVGGAAGVGLSWASVRVIVAFGAAQVPRLAEATVDGRVLAFSLGAAVLAGLLFGIAPAIGLTSRLNDAGAKTGSRQSVRARGALVVAECALAIVLLAGAGLLLRSLDRLRAVDPGFDGNNVLAVRVEFPPDPAADATGLESALATRRYATAADLARRVGSIPGVRAVGFSDDLFLTSPGNESITIPGRAPRDVASGELAEGSLSPGFFETLRVPLRRGRYLSDADAADKIRALWTVNNTGTLVEREARAVFEPVVVNDEFARRFFPGVDPVGKTFCIDPTSKTYWYRIVGVVGDMRRQGLAKPAIAQYFGPWIPMERGRVDLLVRTERDPLVFAATIRQIVREALPGAIIPTISTVDSQLGAFHAQQDFQALLLSLFAALAILLAAVGIYGVVHYSVNERTRELGVRIALGATPGRIRIQVLREGMRGPLIGIAIGIAAALGVTRVLSAALFGVTAADPATYAGVAIVLGLVASAACLAPAIRATKVNPIAALRRD